MPENIAAFGRHGASVRVFPFGERIRAQWLDPETRRRTTKSWPKEEGFVAAALEFAQNKAEELRPRPPLTRGTVRIREARVAWIYVAFNPDNGLYKIGVTGDRSNRLRSLCGDSGSEVEMVATWRGGLPAERELHRRFAADRVRGEWFKPSLALMQLLTARICGIPSALVPLRVLGRTVTDPATAGSEGSVTL